MISISCRKSEAWKTLGVYATLNALLGLWPLDRDSLLQKIRRFIPVFQLVLMVASAIYEIYFSCEYAEYNVELLNAITFGVVAVAKLNLYYIHRDKLRLNVESAIKDWSSLEPSEFHSIMYTWRNTYIRIIRIYMVMSTFVGLMYFFKIYLIDRDSFIELTMNNDDVRNTTVVLKKRFLFPSVCSLNDVSQIFYWIITVNQCYQYICCCVYNVVPDLLFITITYHICGQFEILKQRFANFTMSLTEKQTRREFGNLIARHKHLLKLTELLEESFNIIIFTQMMMNIILIISSGVNILIFLKNNEKSSTIVHFGFIFFLLVQTFMYAHIGENINSQVKEIGQSVYDGSWQTMPKNMSKDMVLLILRSNVSIYLTAGKFSKMTHSTFTAIVKTTFSYLSVLHVVLKDK